MSPHGDLVATFPGTRHGLPPVVQTLHEGRSTTAVNAPLTWGIAPYLITLDSVALLLAGLPMSVPAPVRVLFVAVGVVTFACLGLYRPRLGLSVLDDLPRLSAGVLVGGLGALSLHAVVWHLDRPRWPLTYLVLVLTAVVLVRLAAYAAVRHARRSGWIRHRALVVGAGEVGIRLTRTLQEHREFGLEPVGMLDSRPRVDDPDQLPVPVLGSSAELGSAIRQLDVSQVIVAFGVLRESELVDILRTCDRLRCEIFFVPRLFELHNTTREVDDVRGIPLIRIRRPAYRTFSWRMKRVFDVVLSGVALVVLSPVLAACAIAVRLEGGPDVLFRQERVGLDGRPFEILKFRSLRPADEMESRTTWNIRFDDRLGRVGRLLRSTSLDELPQLWNVLVGDMSLVGPRPERPYFVDQYSSRIPRYMGRHRVPAGLTGWAQVHGLRGDTSIEDRASFDNHYIENWSLWGDVKILLRTVSQVIRRQGG